MTTEQHQKNKNYVSQHKEKTRAMQRATDFVRFSPRSIMLEGYSVASICALMSSGCKKHFEVIVLDNTGIGKRLPGDTVSKNTVFPSSEGLIWDDDRIAFQTKDGILVSIDEYAYFQQHGLNGNELFAVPEKSDGDVSSNWKVMVRRAGEARKDRGTNILYMTLGAIRWWNDDDPSNKKGRECICSPLFLCQSKEDANSKTPRFKLNSKTVQINSTLARLVKTQYFVDIFEGIPSEFAFTDIPKYTDQIRENISEKSDITLLPNDMHLCLLDSSNELMCQAVERNLDEIAKCPIVSVFSDSVPYVSHYVPTLHSKAVYPLPADDTQRIVIEAAIQGESMITAAAPGTGKSQTIANIAVNLTIRGKTVSVISEKNAAIEVVSDYLRRGGLGAYCLYITDKTSVKDIVSQLKCGLAAANVYVDTEQAQAVVCAYNEAVKEIEHFNRVYEHIPELGTNLYNIIGDALETEDMSCAEYFSGDGHFQMAKRKVLGLQSELLDTMSEADWKTFISEGSTGDEEQDDLLNEYIADIEGCGIDIFDLVSDKMLSKSEVAKYVIPQYCRYIAESYIDKLDLKSFGNKKLKMLYKKLVEASNGIQAVSGAFVKQELARRLREAANGNKFVDLLDRLATSNISLQDFFKTYGAELMRLSPIIVATPQTLVNYDSLCCANVIIADESSQIPITNVFPLLRGDKQIIVLGDPNQLDLSSFFAKAGIYAQDSDEFDLSKTDKSLLHVAQGRIPSHQLLFHYRSKYGGLIAVSNLKMYDGLLNVAPDNYISRDNLPDELGMELVEIRDPEIAGNGANISEAKAIVERVIKIRKNYPEKSIGIICLNEVQQNCVNDEIDRRCDEDGLYDILDLNGDKLFLRSLENAQGKEADVIFVCIGHHRRKKNGEVDMNMGALTKDGALNRLNVLFTRAREKMIVTISFSYKELKDSPNPGIYRLYEYLRYIATGVCDADSSTQNATADRFNDKLAARLGSLLTDRTAYRKLGNDRMTVDVGIIKYGDARYDVGVMLPGKALTANSICTKVNVLERAGWSILPLSPISFFTKPELFAKQFVHDVEEKISYSRQPTETFITDVRPPKLFTFDDFAGEPEEPITPMTIEELVSDDYDAAYGALYTEDVIRADTQKLNEMAHNGDSLARIRLVTQKLPAFAKKGRLDDLRAKVEEWHSADGRYAYIYGHLLRVENAAGNEDIIRRLYEESRKLGIKVAA